MFVATPPLRPMLVAMGALASLECGGAAAQQAAVTVDSYAPKEPLWELRVGGSALYGPVYPGASQSKLNGVGAPLFIYRGKRIRFGDYGVARAIAAEAKRVEFDVSLDAAYAANNAKARAGMPKLDYLFQIGPQAVIHLADTGWTADGRTELTAFVPVRGVASSDFKSIEHAGWLAEPGVMYRRQYPGDLRQSWNAKLFVSFADQGLMDYWYGVAPRYAISGRPAYAAKGGYLSTALNVSWTKELTHDFQVYLTYQGRYLAGSTNEASPLLRRDVTHAVSLSFVWKALKSRQPAQNDEM